MRLRSIEVEGWQCFVARCAVGDFTGGLNVVHAPNGTGKSTLFDALRRALFDKHAVGGERIGQLRPWGRDVAPRATVTFEHGGATYRLEKRFLDSPRSMLHRLEGDAFVLLAEAEAADARVQAMLRASPPLRGATSGPEHWGVAGVCWVPQGALALDPLDRSLAAHVRSSLGTQAIGADGGDAIERGVEARFATIFTAQGKFKTGQNEAGVVAHRRRLDELTARRATLVPQVEAFEEASRRVDGLAHERRQARQIEIECDATLATLRAAANRRSAVEAELRELAAAELAARGEHDRVRDRIDTIAAARAAVATAEAERAELAAASPAIEAELRVARRALNEASARVAETRVAREAIAAAAAEAEAAAQLARATADVAMLADRVDRLRSADAALAAIRAEVDAIRAPAADVLRRMRAADAARATARAALDASMITLTIEPNAAARIDARVAERPGAIDVAAGAAATVSGAPDVVVEISGFGRIRARGPSVASIDDLRAAVADADAQLVALAAPFGTVDLDELQRRADAAAACRVRSAVAEASRAAIVGDASPADAERALAHAAKSRAALLAAHPSWNESPPDAAAMRADADERKRRHDREADDAAYARDLAAAGAQRAETAATRHAAFAQNAQRRAADAIAAASCASVADGLDDAARAARRDHAALAWSAARAGLDRARAALASLGDDPAAEVVRAERSLAASIATSAELAAAEHRAAGRLAEIGESGAYSQLAVVDEQIALAADELAAAEAEARAILLLRNTLRAERERLVRSVAGPVEAIAGDVLRRVGGARLADVRLGEGFAPESIASTALATPIDLANLSGGEQEQVHLAVRLALAEVLGEAGAGVVVLRRCARRDRRGPVRAGCARCSKTSRSDFRY